MISGLSGWPDYHLLFFLKLYLKKCLYLAKNNSEKTTIAEGREDGAGFSLSLSSRFKLLSASGLFTVSFSLDLNPVKSLQNYSMHFFSAVFMCSRSASGLPSKYWKRPSLVPRNSSPFQRNGCGFRCHCSVSVSQPAATETTPSSVR